MFSVVTTLLFFLRFFTVRDAPAASSPEEPSDPSESEGGGGVEGRFRMEDLFFEERLMKTVGADKGVSVVEGEAIAGMLEASW